MMNQDKEEQIFKKRITELANAAYYRGICYYTDFLNLNEQSLFYSMKAELPRIKYFPYGGFIDAERKILCFCGNDHPDQMLIAELPIDCIKITPLNQKYSDSLTHRDFLGAILNLGIDRSKTGDILIASNEGYLFVHNSISDFIMGQLTKVKHTMVRTMRVNLGEFHYTPRQKEMNVTVSSIRLDNMISAAFCTSRSSLTGLIEGGKVFVGGRQILSKSYLLKEKDVVSVRGLGKFIYEGITSQTKKGRYGVKIRLFDS